jgi:hypothetical protein
MNPWREGALRNEYHPSPEPPSEMETTHPTLGPEPIDLPITETALPSEFDELPPLWGLSWRFAFSFDVDVDVDVVDGLCEEEIHRTQPQRFTGYADHTILFDSFEMAVRLIALGYERRLAYRLESAPASAPAKETQP